MYVYNYTFMCMKLFHVCVCTFIIYVHNYTACMYLHLCGYILHTTSYVIKISAVYTWYMYTYLLDEDKSKVFVYSTTLIAIFTCGTSVLLWWLYKECFRSKDKYDVEGRYMCRYEMSPLRTDCYFISYVILIQVQYPLMPI